MSSISTSDNEDDDVPDPNEWYEEDGFVVNVSDSKVLQDIETEQNPRLEMSATNIVLGKRKRVELKRDVPESEADDDFSDSVYEHDEDDDDDFGTDEESDEDFVPDLEDDSEESDEE
jgi:hypothetical protein